MNEVKSIVFASISNVPFKVAVQSVVVNRWPSMKSFHFNFLMENPHFYESEQVGLQQEDTRSHLGTYPIILIDGIHGHRLNRGYTRRK